MFPQFEAAKHGESSGCKFVDITEMVKVYLADRLRSFAVILPTDSSARGAPIMQYVEKRIVRCIPRHIPNCIHVFALGRWANLWKNICGCQAVAGATRHTVPWPSETVDLGPRHHHRPPILSGGNATAHLIGREFYSGRSFYSTAQSGRGIVRIRRDARLETGGGRTRFPHPRRATH